MKSRFIRRGGLWVLAQLALLIAVVVLPRVERHQWRGTWSAIVGEALFVLGGAAGILAVIALGRSRTAFPMPVEKGVLVERGIYRFIRHPLYSSLILLSVGWGFLWQSGPTLAVAMVLAVHLGRKARREEVWLRQKYPTYAAYEKRVGGFVPGNLCGREELS